jgi:hypothetical protein
MAAKKKISRDEESYYVSVKNPADTRRHLLESTKKSLISLQNYHKLLMMRQEKSKHMETLRQSIKELSYLNNRLSQKLPDYNSGIMDSFKKEKHIEKKPIAKKIEVPVKEKIFEKPHHERSELEKLEASLSSIEEKLKGLD